MVVVDDSQVPNRDYAEFVIRTSKKTVKQEDSLVRQILYTCWSAYTQDPINLGIIAPTSEGKTYPLVECLKFVPKDDVWTIGQMSTKVLVRQKGTIVNEKGEPIGEKITELLKQMAGLKKDDPQRFEFRNQLEELKENAKYVIDLRGKILVFLEPPHHELWNLLKPILSHDSLEIEFPFVDRTDKSGFEVRKIVTIGWPACIFCSAKDESNWPVWEEIKSRFLITSPNMNKVKYHESNLLIAQRKSLPALIQQQVIISNKEIELAKVCFEYVKQNVQEYSKANISGQSGPVWIPYGQILGEALPSDRGTDTRAAKRLFAFLNIIPATRAELRPKLLYNQDRMIIATLDDLQEVLHITQNLNGLPSYKIKFYREVLYELYKSKTSPDNNTQGESEDRIALTTKQLVDYYREKTCKAITSNNMKNTFLNELLNAGYIDSETSRLNKR